MASNGYNVPSVQADDDSDEDLVMTSSSAPLKGKARADAPPRAPSPNPALSGRIGSNPNAASGSQGHRQMLGGVAVETRSVCRTIDGVLRRSQLQRIFYSGRASVGDAGALGAKPG